MEPDDDLTGASRALVLADASSHYYVVPLEVIASLRVDDGARDQIDDALGVDCMGFASLGHGFSLVGPITVEPGTGLPGMVGDA
jgi:hypothetical protein